MRTARIFTSVLLLLVTARVLSAAQLDTLRIPSPSMHKTISAVIVIPDAYHEGRERFPVVYLLHGYSGSYRDWAKHLDLRPLADRYGFILICPDGGYNSWYLDSPLDVASQYETHIIKEVIPFVDNHYRTIRGKNGRAITGLSMGGHGALYLAARHPGLFYAAASMSGGVDLTYSTKKWEIALKLGPYKKYPDRWHRNSVVNMIDQLKKAGLKLLVDCGVKDIFINNNRQLHQKLLNAGVDHDYVERPGGHSWAYWINALEYHLLFFYKQKPGSSGF